MKTFKFQDNLPKIDKLKQTTIDGKRFYTTPNGVRLPSVTTVLGSFEKEGIVKWRKRVGEKEANSISSRASIRGKGFHNIMEKYVGNDQKDLLKGEMPDTKEIFRNCQKYLDLIDNIMYIESMLFSECIGLAGQVDLIAEWKGIPSIIDWKTSLKPKKEEWIRSYFEQATAYSLLFEDMTGIQIRQLVIFVVNDYEEPQIFIRDRKHYFHSLAKKLKDYKNDQKLQYGVKVDGYV